MSDTTRYTDAELRDMAANASDMSGPMITVIGNLARQYLAERFRVHAKIAELRQGARLSVNANYTKIIRECCDAIERAMEGEQ